MCARCTPLGEIANVTVGIQVYHHTRVSKELIKARGFHGRIKQGNDWYQYIEANDVQRYFSRRTSDQWLKYSDLLHDKRELSHYAEPRILVQQIFWQRLSAWYESPSSPSLYLNTLFAVYGAKDIPLECVLGIINSRIVSATYERRANRLFGDKFPKVSKSDLASVPIPKMKSDLVSDLIKASTNLQCHWEALRSGLESANRMLSSLPNNASLVSLGEFWQLSEKDFFDLAREKFGQIDQNGAKTLIECYGSALATINAHWHHIRLSEDKVEDLVKRAYTITDKFYEEITKDVPAVNILWALRAVR